MALDIENSDQTLERDIGYRFVRFWGFVSAWQILRQFDPDEVPDPIDDITAARLQRALSHVYRVAVHRGFLPHDFVSIDS